TVGSDFVCIINSEEVEKIAAGAEQNQHTVIIRAKGSSENSPDISIDKPRYETFKDALTSMGIDEQDIDRYARESGQSPTILRRRLSENEAIKVPPWAKNIYTSENIIPFILAGHWNTNKDGDREVLNY